VPGSSRHKKHGSTTWTDTVKKSNGIRDQN